MSGCHDYLVVLCECTTQSHIVVFFREDDGAIGVDVSWPRDSFWRRVKTALRYVMSGTSCRFCAGPEILVSPQDREKLKQWLEAGDK